MENNNRNILYDKFKIKNEVLFQSYDENLIKCVFNEVTSFFSVDHESFTIEDVAEIVKIGLEKNGIASLQSESIIEPAFMFYLEELGYYTNNFNEYTDAVKKIIESSLNPYLKDISLHLDKMTDAVIAEFSSRDIRLETLDIANSLMKNTELKDLPFVIIHNTVNSVYDYFEEMNLLGSEN